MSRARAPGKPLWLHGLILSGYAPRSAALLAVTTGDGLDWIETHGGFGDWRCRACFEPLDPDVEDGRTLRQVVEELLTHLDVCDA